MVPFGYSMRLNVNFIIRHVPLQYLLQVCLSIYLLLLHFVFMPNGCSTVGMQHSGTAHSSPNMPGSFTLPYLCTHAVLSTYSFLFPSWKSTFMCENFFLCEALSGGSSAHISIIEPLGRFQSLQQSWELLKRPLCNQHLTDWLKYSQHSVNVE